jgi:hypothetical protein
MRYRFMATYRGVPYEAGVGPSDNDIMLFAACPPPEDLGFQPDTGHWRKAVTRAEVDAIWESRPSGMFAGEPCLVLDNLGDQLHIGYPGHDPLQAERLGYCEVEPGVYEVLVNREDVTGIIEERVDRPYPPAAAMSWPATQVPAWSAPPPLPPFNPPPLPSFNPQPSRSFTPPPEPSFTPSPTPSFASASVTPAAPRGPLAPGTPAPDATAWPAPVAVGAVPVPTVAPAAPALPERAGRAGSSRRRHRGTETGPSWAQTRQTFTELANLAAIPPTAYAVDEEVDGAICLLRNGTGFEVFSAVDGTRQEIRLFADEEAAYFYMFGLLAAEAVRDGRLAPPR